MTDFKIKRGLSSVVFSEPGIINPNLIIEEGTWYLCTDTAELYLGITVDGELTLKQINGEHGAPTEGETTIGIVDAYIKEETGELWVVFADGSEKALGSVTGASETVSIKIGENTFEAVDGVIELPEVNVPEVNLDDYAKLTDIPDTSEFITMSDVEAKNYLTSHQDISHLAEKDHVHSEYATKDHEHEQYLTEHQDLSDYAKKSDIPIDYIKEIPSEYITESELATELAKIEHPTVSLDGYATEDFVRDAIAKAELGDKDIDLTGYATKDDIKDFASTTYVDEKVAGISILEVPTKVSAFENDAKYLQNKYEVLPIEGMFVQYRDGEIRLNTQRVTPTHQNVGATGNPNMYYATFRAFAPEGATQCKEGLNGTIDTEYSALATDEQGRKYTTIWAAIASYNGTSWSLFGANSNLDKYLGFYYHFEWYNEDTLIGTDKVRVILTNDSCHDDLVPDAVARRIDEKIKTIDTPEAELYKVDFNDPDYAKAVEAYNDGKVLVLINAAPDVNSYAVMNYVSEKYITFTKFLTSRSEAYGSFNTYYLSPANTWEVSKEVRLNKVEANVDGETNGELASIRIGKEIYSLPSTDGLATETFVLNKIAEAELGDKDVDISGLATKDELSQVEAKIPSLEGYAKTEDIPTDYLTAIPEEYVTESELAEELAKIEHPKTDLTGYATEEFVAEAVAGIEIPDAYDDSELRNLIDSKADAEHTHDQYLTEHQDISHLATKEEIPDVSEFITSVPEEYITNDELEAKGYLTEHQSLEDYATEEYVVELIEGIEIPETDLSEYSKTVDMNAAIKLATDVKADKIPFAESKIVGKDVGLFKAGDDVKDLTIAQILAKLLELSDNNVTPEEPEIPSEPDEPGSVIDQASRLAMYSVNMNNALAPTSSTNIVTMSPEEAAGAPTFNGFYQIEENGEVIESGYQEMTISKEDTYYVIALPKVIDYESMIEIQAYDADEDQWYNCDKLPLISDPETVAVLCEEAGVDISDIDTDVYTVWVDEASPTGSQLRYIIKEA